MLSSTIRELADLRQWVEERVELLGVAQAWRFEEHAAASGAAPDTEYLGVASSCDLYVIIIAAEQSEATESEYLAAYADNPEKVLAFFVGDGSPEVAPFRQLIDGRHLRVKKDAPAELVMPIVEAISEAIETGRIIRPLLIADIDDRIERARTAVAEIPLIHIPHVNVDGTARRASEIIRLDEHVALSGIGGSGKTMAAAIAARSAAGDGRTLPVYVEPSEQRTDILSLVQARFHSTRFDASSTLVAQWANQARLLVVVDGIEGLSAVSRRRMQDSAVRWAEEFPRSGLVVCARRFSDLELPGFTQASAAPLSDDQMRDLISVLGATQPVRLPDQVRDIGRWPMWAVALLVYGPQATTGLELLQRFVEARLSTAGMSSVIERAELRAAASFIASRIWPAIGSGADDLLAALDEWSRESLSGSKFMRRPAEDIANRLAKAGILEIGDEIVFPHRLLATILAAEYAIGNTDRGGAADEELAPFIAALSDDDSHLGVLHSVLDAHSIFIIARYLRLAPARSRTAELEPDVLRFADAVRRWTLANDYLDVVHSERWIAWRSSDHFSFGHIKAEEYDRWRAQSNHPITFWSASPFMEHTPEFVAALYALSLFREQALVANPGGNPYAQQSASRIGALLGDDDALTAAVLEAMQQQRDRREALLQRMGLGEAAALRPRAGQSQVSIWVENGRAIVQVAHDGGAPTVTRLNEAPVLTRGFRTSLAALLTPEPDAAVYAGVVRDIEAELGCRLGAQNWSRPELVPSWAW